MPTVQLHGAKFEQMIARRGRNVEWQRASMCSCWNATSGQALYSCKACGGHGYVYDAPAVARALLMSIASSKMFEDFAGQFEAGDAVLTVPKNVYELYNHPLNTSGVATLKLAGSNPMFEIGMYDIITILDDDTRTSEIVVKGTPLYGRPADTLIHDRVANVHSIRTMNPGTGEVTLYKPDINYTMDENHVAWIVGAVQPAEGAQYSVDYDYRPSYTVLTTLPKPRHQDSQDLPKFVAIRFRGAVSYSQQNINGQQYTQGGGTNEPFGY